MNATGSGNAHTGGLAGEATRVSIEDCLVRSTVDSSSSSAESYTGGLAGKISSGSSIESCHVTGSVNATGSGSSSALVYAGVLAGDVEDSSIKNCSVEGPVTASSTSDGVYAGVLAGSVDGGSIENCHVNGSVSIPGSGFSSLAGGLAGKVDGGSTIMNCHVNGSVTATASYEVFTGGLAGDVSDSTIKNCSATGPVNIPDSVAACAGGLAGGVIRGSIKDCSAEGQVTVTSAEAFTGGLVGDVLGGSIENCSATGPVTASSTANTVSTGGLAGRVSSGSGGITITDCTAKGAVTATGDYVVRTGGFAGDVSSGSGDGDITIRNCTAEGAVNASSTANAVSTGGLAGRVSSESGSGGITITDCTAKGAVNASSTGSGNAHTGGLAGWIVNIGITNCTVHSTVNSSSTVDSYAGGLAGRTSGSIIEYSSVTAEVTSTSSVHPGSSRAGGLAGYADSSSTIKHCSVTGTATSSSADSSFAGGLAGYTDSSSIQNCYATVPATSFSTGSSNSFAGGLAGYADNSSSIEHCYATGRVTSTGLGPIRAGGLAGGVTATSTITNSAALNEWINVSSTEKIGRLYGEGSQVSTDSYAWRHMGLNISGTITKAAGDSGKNATNASTVMIWNNETFFQTLFGQTNYDTNWTMGTDPDYLLPVLQNAANHNADARHLNRTHEITATATGDGTITPESAECSDGAAITFDLTGIPPNWFTDNDNDVTVSGTTYTIADVDTDHTIAAEFPPAMPHVDTASITAYNTTAANITFTLTNSAGADGAWINLTSQSDQSIISTPITESVPAGSSSQPVRLTGLTPGHAYQLNITPLNTTIGGTPVTFTCSTLYTAPVPEIVFENATTGTPVNDSLTLTNGQTTVIRANITNTTLELINETVSWAQTGTGFTTSDPGTAYPYNITLTSDINADGTITITVGGIQKTLNIISPSPPSSSEYSTRVLFETSGGSFISPATLLSPGDRVAEPPAPVKDGYTFGGWYTDETCTKAWNFSDSIPGDMTLYAKWSIESTPQTETPTAQPTAPAPASQTETPTAQPTATTPPATTPTSSSGPTSTEAPAPVAGLLIGLLAAGTLFMRKN